VTDLERTTEAEGLAGRLRALTSKLVLAEQRERHRLASELHDYLSQNLVVCRMALDRAMRTSGADQRALLDEASAALTECIGYCRSMVADLSPAVLYQAGLYPALRWLGQRMGRHGLQVDFDMEETFVPEEDRAIILFQSVRELLFNVLKHSQADRATVCVRNRGGEFSLTVADAGRGFDPVAQESSTAFGLFAVREQLSNIGGRFEIESGAQGTRVTLRLPHVAPGPPQNVSEGVPGKIRVLLADDHATVREGLRRILMDDPELEVVGEAANGDEAIALARALHPDVVLMDIHMPKTDGITATRAIKHELRRVHVIGLSMHDGSEFAEAMLQAGASAYLTKDGRGAELLAAIHACISPTLEPQPRA
jgi:CheY-like chemotaxis protein